MKLSVCLDGNNGTFGARMRKISVLIGTAAKAAVRSARSKSPLSAPTDSGCRRLGQYLGRDQNAHDSVPEPPTPAQFGILWRVQSKKTVHSGGERTA
jgi:hypothetical protein